MKTVYVSHVKEDKGRLTPYLDMILESDPGNIRLCIDRPHEIPSGRLFKPDDPETVVGIEIGERWDDEFEKVLKEVDAVLVFWSENSRTKHSFRQIEEIYNARRTGKLVAASFDDPAKVPFHFPYMKVIDLSRSVSSKENIFVENNIFEILDIEININYNLDNSKIDYYENKTDNKTSKDDINNILVQENKSHVNI